MSILGDMVYNEIYLFIKQLCESNTCYQPKQKQKKEAVYYALQRLIRIHHATSVHRTTGREV